MATVRDYVYDIRHFTWVKEENTFFASEEDLYDIQNQYPYPNGRKQFFIKNKKTKNQKRFRFVKDSELYQNLYYEFESEEGYKCVIKLADRSSVQEQIKRKINKHMAEQLSLFPEGENTVETNTLVTEEIVNNWDSVTIQINNGNEGAGAIRMMKQDIVAMANLHGVDRGYIMDMMIKALETTPIEDLQKQAQTPNE